VILVEGLFDCAVLWEAGFDNVACALGTHLNARQLQQLCDAPAPSIWLLMRTVMAAVNKQRRIFHDVSENAASLFASSRCLRATIPTASLSRAATPGSSRRCWSPLSHEMHPDTTRHYRGTGLFLPLRLAPTTKIVLIYAFKVIVGIL